MDKFTAYWSHISSGDRILILMGGMIFFWLLEGYYPLFRFSFKRWKHAGVNLIFLGTTLALNLIFGLVTIKVCLFVEAHQFGLLYWLGLPTIWSWLIGMLFMDFFGQYLPHWLMHHIKFMWKFHMVHHSDTKVDVTTGTRHHPGEWLFRETSTIIGILLIGVPVGLYFLYRSCAALFTHFNHANIRVPPAIDRPISWIFVSPNMHKAHHHYQRPLTDTNYSNIFSLWDRLFGTFAYEDPRNLRYGLDVLDDTTDEKVGYQFKIPFDSSIKTDY
ncbi:sterol desaturase family protein [Flavihumibacter petaseus]|uniref:Putative oxidoreductase n=1 Tax=Flavihumibacter petaseus NBRC 106054 TaxID=1220578 RepID=A0A0E9MXC3_9BACT|nr:sterol desaturase family protein [Flavihumibacter petaseus]GAO42264.1 putative oxidoreductase [Flavihumibacter petaseus NBRC 106054]